MDTSVFQKNGKYLMLALDHRGSFKKYVKPDSPDSATDDDVIAVKRSIIESLEDQFSGVLIDPDWGLPAYAKASAGKPAKPYLLCLEKSGYTDEKGERKTELLYSGKQLKEWGASGAKLLVYFNPEASNCDYQLEVSKQALEDAHANNLPLFLEIVTYGNDELEKSRSEWVLRSLQMFIEKNIIPDVWKLEYPEDADSCKKITEIVTGTPWILLTRGDSFEHFEKQLQDAVNGGAIGFLAGRALWQEISSHVEDKKNFLEEVVRDRFKKITDICL